MGITNVFYLSSEDPDPEKLKSVLKRKPGKDYFVCFGDASRAKKEMVNNGHIEACKLKIYEIYPDKRFSQV